ncbi:MAG: V-type ATPase subunit [Acholeplasmataceae bacterium]|nr:V-type ATPase subunit [Acholeplasmataceae bacterium]
MSSWSNNALISKAKSMYGEFLKPSDYEKLIKYHSVPDLVGFLKKHPHYQDILKDVSETSIHRGNLEALIKKNAFDNVIKLMKSVYSKDVKYYELNIVKQENEIILSAIRTFISDEVEDNKGKIPYFFDTHSEIDIKKIIKADSFEALIEALKKTPYEKILLPFYTRNNDNIRYLDIEHALESYYYDQAFMRIEQHYKGKLKADLESIFQTKIELSNITKIYRLKKFYQADPVTIKSVLVRKHSRLKEKRIDEMIALKDADQILSYLAKSEYQMFKNDKDYVYIEYYAGQIKYDLAKKFMYFSTKVPKVYTAFITLAEIEIDNITNIIEGIRYQVSEVEMKQMLIY